LNVDERSSRGRVERVVAAGRRIQDPKSPVGRHARLRLSETSGLSEAGIELALMECLETNPGQEEIRTLLARTGRAPRCHVILAANVCTAPLRALALAVATSPRVVVRPSRRDPVVTEALVEILAADQAFGETYGGTIEMTETIAPAPSEELHVYGSDASIEAIARGLPEGVLVRAHGTGFGVAVIGANDDLEAAAESLAADVVPFDQRGCLSPRVALVEGFSTRMERFAAHLEAALTRAGERVPRGPLDPEAAAEIAMYGASMEAVGSFFGRQTFALGLDPSPRALVLPPAARVVHVAPAQADDARRLLEPWASFVTIVGANDLEGAPLVRAVYALVPHARRAPLGRMQMPPLDGPVDLRPPRSTIPAGV